MQKIKPILFGMLAAGVALVTELVLSDTYFIFSGQEIETRYFDQITLFLFVAVMIEEIAKYLFIQKIYSTSEKNVQKISAAILVGLGFAVVEFFFIYFNSEFVELYPGAFGAVALHLATAGTIGLSILAAENSNIFTIARTVTTAFGLHAIYNLMVIYNLPYALIYVYLLCIFSAIFVFNQKIQRPDNI